MYVFFWSHFGFEPPLSNRSYLNNTSNLLSTPIALSPARFRMQVPEPPLPGQLPPLQHDHVLGEHANKAKIFSGVLIFVGLTHSSTNAMVSTV